MPQSVLSCRGAERVFEAADAKCITQPAMSHLIRSLEEELQVKLINRDGKTVSLTPADDWYISRPKIS